MVEDVEGTNVDTVEDVQGIEVDVHCPKVATLATVAGKGVGVRGLGFRGSGLRGLGV